MLAGVKAIVAKAQALGKGRQHCFPEKLSNPACLKHLLHAL